MHLNYTFAAQSSETLQGLRNALCLFRTGVEVNKLIKVAQAYHTTLVPNFI